MGKNSQELIVNSVSRLAAGTSFKGELTCPGDIRIDGNFEGRIFSKGKVVIAETAVVEGEISCDSMDLAGKMKGVINVSDLLTLEDGCVMSGEVHTRRLSVFVGAVLDGTCGMIDAAGAPQA